MRLLAVVLGILIAHGFALWLAFTGIAKGITD